MKIFDNLLAQAEKLESSDNEALVMAEDSGSEIMLGIVSDALVHAAAILREAANHVKDAEVEAENSVETTFDGLAPEHLDEVAALASELDESEDPSLRKKASVLDQILLTIGAPPDAKESFKKAEEKEINRLREKYREQACQEAYHKSKEESDKDIKVADAIKAIEKSVKQYRPLEAPLSTRTCPDHPGAQMMRIGDGIWQCDLDKKVYNYQGGYETMKGNKVPGGDVSLQTQSLNDRPPEHMSFDTRESKLNS